MTQIETRPRRDFRDFANRFLPTLAMVVGVVIALAISLRAAGLLIPYRIPAAGMQPAIRNGDCVAMEGVSYLFNAPRRGDLIVFRTKDIPSLGIDEVFVTRVAGLPGDRLRIFNGGLEVNGHSIAFPPGNAAPVRYLNAGSFLRTSSEEFVVPAETYFVLGDNSANSLDSRYFGPVRKSAITGKVWFRYWPWR